jgi:hypothetical protein
MRPTPPVPGTPSPAPPPSPALRPSPAVSPTLGPAPETAAPQPTPEVEIEWLRGDLEGEFTPLDLISDATTVGGTVVAVGEDGSGIGEAAAWLSVDGSLWRQAPAVPAAGQSVMEDVTVGPAGIVAVGYSFAAEGIVPMVWVSQDGLEWQVSEDADLRRGQMSAVAANALTYVALGFDPETDEGLAWTSRDGRDWSAALSVPAFEVQPSVNDVIALGDGFLAYGSTARNERAALWTSFDGQEWQLVGGFPTSPSSTVNAVTASATQLVAVGASYLERGTMALAWTSQDGLEWQRVLDHDAFEEGEMLGVVSLATGFLAVGRAGGDEREDLRAAVWTSPDGLSWLREPDDPTFARARMSDVLRAGPGLVALGERADDPALEEFTPAVWLGVAR